MSIRQQKKLIRKRFKILSARDKIFWIKNLSAKNLSATEKTYPQEIQDLLDKKIIRKSYSPWSCTAFYVNKATEKERGVPRLVVNYKPLNEALKWVRYPIPNKKDLLDRLYMAKIFSKFDLISGYWQIQIAEKDMYKTAFTVPFGHYEWNVMPFGLKNAPLRISEYYE